MSQHIPGPWQVIAQGGAIYEVMEHAHTYSYSIHGDYSDATARLIAAAPDLLEALAGLVGCIDHGSENPTAKLDAARAAIAKATGEKYD